MVVTVLCCGKEKKKGKECKAEKDSSIEKMWHSVNKGRVSQLNYLEQFIE